MRYRGRSRRRGNPLVVAAVFGLIFVIMTIVFVALGVQEFQREHDKSWSYDRVAFLGCRYDHTHKRTTYYDCEVGDPSTGAVLYSGGTTSVSTSYHSSPPRSGSRWLHRVDGQVVAVGKKFPLWVEFFLLIPLTLFVTALTNHRRSRRRRLAAGGSGPDGFGPPPGQYGGYAPPPGQFGPPGHFGAPPVSGGPFVSDEPQFPGAGGRPG